MSKKQDHELGAALPDAAAQKLADQIHALTSNLSRSNMKQVMDKVRMLRHGDGPVVDENPVITRTQQLFAKINAHRASKKG
ncbi:MAG: hypothetical protein ACREJN_21330 [Nitrospiraceae bacterium]